MTSTPWTTDESLRRGIRHVIDVLLPGDGEMPSGAEVAVEDELLQRVLTADPRLLPAVLAVSRRVVQENAPSDLDEFIAWCGEDFEQVAFAVNAAYYMSATVWAVLGYPGQRRMPIALATPDQIASDELVAPVINRGPIFVPTPTLEGQL